MTAIFARSCGRWRRSDDGSVIAGCISCCGATGSISGRRVVRELTALIAERGKPGMIVSDNGTELTSNAVLAWCGDAKVEWHYTAPASRPRMPSSRASMAGCVTSCSTRRCS